MRTWIRSAMVGYATFCLVFLFLPGQWMLATGNTAAADVNQTVSVPPPASAESLGVHFVPGSTSTIILERDGKTYLVNLADQTVRLKDSPVVSPKALLSHTDSAQASQPDVQSGAKIFADKCEGCHGPGGRGGGTAKTPDFANPGFQSTMPSGAILKIIRDGKPGTQMPAWSGRLSDADINAVAGFVKSLGDTTQPGPGAPSTPVVQSAKVYTPADDYLFSLPTGRKLDRHGLYLNFTHRFAYSPAFSGTGEGDTLAGLDNFSISSFGFRFGVTDKLSVSAYRSPSLINRPIELGIAYNFLDEHLGAPLNAEARISVDGQNDFDRNFTTNFELILSRSIRQRAQLYLVPTISLQDRMLTSKPGSLASIPPAVPGINAFALGFGGAFDIRPTVAIVAEAMPTLVNGAELGIHRPAFAFGIQKRVLRHAFTLGFTNSPGTIVSQRAGTDATFTGNPSADTPKGLFIGFDLMRQIY